MNKKIIALIFLSISILSLKTYCANETDFQKKHPFAYANIKVIATFIIKDMLFSFNLKNKSIFKEGPEPEKKLIRNLARKIGFSKKAAKKIEVKTPLKGTVYDAILKNNHAAYRNTVLLGNYNNEALRDLIENNKNVKKFIYAHELSHIKHWHRTKHILSLVSCPFLVHYSFKFLNRGIKHVVPKICGDKYRPYVEIFLSECKKLTPLKFAVQALLALRINRKMEHTADMGAASLGPNIIKGGIKFIKTVQGRKRNWLITKILRIFSTHPHPAQRVAYLQEELDRQEKSDKK